MNIKTNHEKVDSAVVGFAGSQVYLRLRGKDKKHNKRNQEKCATEKLVKPNTGTHKMCCMSDIYTHTQAYIHISKMLDGNMQIGKKEHLYRV